MRRLPTRFAQLALDVWGHVLVALEPLRQLRRGAVGAPLVGGGGGWLSLPFWAAIEAVVPGARLLGATFALTATALGVALPSSPGFIGVFQLVGQQALVTPFPDRYTPASALLIALLNCGGVLRVVVRAGAGRVDAAGAVAAGRPKGGRDDRLARARARPGGIAGGRDADQVGPQQRQPGRFQVRLAVSAGTGSARSGRPAGSVARCGQGRGARAPAGPTWNCGSGSQCANGTNVWTSTGKSLFGVVNITRRRDRQTSSDQGAC